MAGVAMNRDNFLKITFVMLLGVVLFFAGPISAKSETYYKYVDKNGTVVITQNWDDVPENQRKNVEEVHFSERSRAEDKTRSSSEIEAVGKDEKAVFKKMITEEKIKEVAEESLRQGKALFSFFIKDQKTILMAYAVAGIAGFFLFSKLLKRFVGGFVTKIVMKLAVVVVIFSGVYLLYLSWLSKTVLNFNQPGNLSEQNMADQITTPQEILQQTQEVVDQFNKNASQREALLNGMDGS